MSPIPQVETSRALPGLIGATPVLSKLFLKFSFHHYSDGDDIVNPVLKVKRHEASDLDLWFLEYRE